MPNRKMGKHMKAYGYPGVSNAERQPDWLAVLAAIGFVVGLFCSLG